MQQLQQSLQTAHKALQRGEFDAARQALSGSDHPKALHLLALVEKTDGNLQLASQLFERAATGDPRDPEIANNQGILARQLEQLPQAEAAFRRALELQPAFLPAGTGLGRLLIDLERWQDAADIYDRMLAIAPENVLLRYGYATVQLGLGAAEEAAAVLDRLVDTDKERSEFRFMRARARLELGQVEAGLADLEIAHGVQPTNLSLKTLANTLWMNGDRGAFAKLLASSAREPQLFVTVAEIYRQSGDTQKALDVINAMQAHPPIPAEAWTVAALAYIDLSDPAAAEDAARTCLAVDSENRVVKGALISALLMQGRADEALELTLKMRQIEPDGQHWIAYEATALRLLGSDRYGELVDLDRFVRPYELPVPRGFDDLESFNGAFLAALERCQPYQMRPLDQSLRDGSQTPRDLTTIDDPVVKAFIAALDQPIRQYLLDVSNGENHPLTARNNGDYRIAGCWSVRLAGHGYHVNHVHPEGWISSAYYVSVPEETKTGRGKAGWIKFGEPPFATEPALPPQKWIRPEAGMLVLFPSFLWHGTAAIEDGSVRVTAPFDAVPA